MTNNLLFRVLKQSIPTTFRIFLASTFLIYGLAKLVMGQFGVPPAEIVAIRGEGFALAWTFFGYSRFYELFIGLGEIISAILILIPRTATLGALCYFPIVVNVMVLNYCYNIGVQDLSTLLMVMCSLLIWKDRKKLLLLIN